MQDQPRGVVASGEPRRTVRLGLTGLVILAALGLLSRPAEAITIKALAIIGKNDNSGVDARIPASVRQALVSTFRYNSYALHSSAGASAAVNQRVTLPLAGPYALAVKPLEVRGEGRDRRILLQVDIVRGDVRVVGAAVWLKPGRYWLLGGPAVHDGVLIVAMAVSD